MAGKRYQKSKGKIVSATYYSDKRTAVIYFTTSAFIIFFGILVGLALGITSEGHSELIDGQLTMKYFLKFDFFDFYPFPLFACILSLINISAGLRYMKKTKESRKK